MQTISTRFHAFFNPEQFQGWGKSKKYFEGWYFKVLNKAENKAFAIIPGIAMDDEGNRQSFIQVLDGIGNTAEYHRFEFNEFSATPGRFEVRVGDNVFTERFIQLNLSGLKGRLDFSGNKPWPKPWYSPGIMGPYSFVPFMECYHGIVSMDHSISGSLLVKDENIDFSEGKGYIEKDWGRSFPSWYIWMQSNHFREPGVSIKSSVANIPWIGSSFTGYIAGLQIHDKLYRFTTYNGTRLLKMESDEAKVELAFENRQYRLEIFAKRSKSVPLASPVRGFMDGRIEESMSGEIEVKLTGMRREGIIMDDRGRNGAIEVSGRKENQ